MCSECLWDGGGAAGGEPGEQRWVIWVDTVRDGCGQFRMLTDSSNGVKVRAVRMGDQDVFSPDAPI